MRHLQYRGELGLGLLPGLSRRPGHPALSILTPSGSGRSFAKRARARPLQSEADRTELALRRREVDFSRHAVTEPNFSVILCHTNLSWEAHNVCTDAPGFDCTFVFGCSIDADRGKPGKRRHGPG